MNTAANKVASFLEATPDSSGRAFDQAVPLPHECGVPLQRQALNRNVLVIAVFRTSMVIFTWRGVVQ